VTTHPPRLISFDLGNTLADIDGPSHVDRIRTASPLPQAEVQRILAEELRLKTLPSRAALTDELRRRICDQLAIADTDFLFGTAPPAPYRLRPGAPAAVRAASVRAQTAIIANLSVFSAETVDPVRDGLSPHLDALHASWVMGVAKPAPEVFLRVAEAHGVTVAEVVHVSSNWQRDIAPVLRLGGRAVWLAPTGTRPPVRTPRDRFLTAPSALDAVTAAIGAWLPRTAHPA
jgi:FMN phosphatase YigB (HAD superfamily)